MSGVQIRFTDQPITYPVGGVVAGGQFVEATQTKSEDTSEAVVIVAAATSKTAIGVALRDAAPAGTDSSTDAAARPANTTVARRGCVVPVTFAAASKFGDRLKCAATGKVTPIAAADLADTLEYVVAINVTTGGTTAESAVGYVQIAV